MHPATRLVGELLAIGVQRVGVRLLFLVRGDAEARPVAAQLAVALVQRFEIPLDGFRLGVLHAGGRHLVASDRIDWEHGLHRIVVALYLVGPVALAEQFGRMVHGVADSLFYQRRVLLLADGVAYRVVRTRVEDDHHGKAVRVGRDGVALLVGGRTLEIQLHVPAVEAPHVERQRRAAAFHLHRTVVVELRCTQASGSRFQPALFTHDLHRAHRYRFPTELLGDGVVDHHDLLVVQVTRVGEQFYKHGLLIVALDFRGIRILELAGDQHLVVRFSTPEELVKFLLQTARIFGQRVREPVGDTGQRLCRLRPKFGLLDARFADAHAMRVGPVDPYPERFEYRGVVGVLLLLGEVQTARAVDLVFRIEIHRNTVRRDLVDKLLARGPLLQVGVTAVNRILVFHRKAINGEQSLAAVAAAT